MAVLVYHILYQSAWLQAPIKVHYAVYATHLIYSTGNMFDGCLLRDNDDYNSRVGQQLWYNGSLLYDICVTCFNDLCVYSRYTPPIDGRRWVPIDWASFSHYKPNNKNDWMRACCLGLYRSWLLYNIHTYTYWWFRE